MKNLLILGLFLTFGQLPAAFAQAPAGYVSIDDVAVEKGIGALAIPPPVTEVIAEPAPAKPIFVAKEGASLRDTLERWTKEAGWAKVSWKLPSDLDFTLGMAGTYEGDFMTATRQFVDALGCEGELRVLFNPSTKVALVEPI